MTKSSLIRLPKFLLLPVFLTSLVMTGFSAQVTEDIQGKLVKTGIRGGLVSHTMENEPPVYAFLFSASWCPHCVKNMPWLRAKYLELKKTNPNGFELIFVSADRSAEEMRDFMVGKGMPWPALAYDQRGAASVASAYKGSGIPSMVLVTKDGRFISGSYKNKGSGEYVGLKPVVETLEKLLGAGKGGASDTAESAEEAADAVAEKIGISRDRLLVASILAAATFLILFFKN